MVNCLAKRCNLFAGYGQYVCRKVFRWLAIRNIFWNNNSVGLYLGNGSANLVFNAYGILGGSAPAATFGNFVKVNPKFLNASGGDFHLLGTSPLLGVSTELVTYDDLDGNLHPQSGRGDLGAYEDTVFIDGLDGG